MKIAIRAESSLDIGTGHIMRCLTLAGELRSKGAQVEFFCQDLLGNVSHLIAEKSFPVHFLRDQDSEEFISHLRISGLSFDGIIVDHYKIDFEWEKKVRPFCKKLMIIDDLADRSHDCDLLVDSGFVNNFAERYNSLVPIQCKKLLGPDYALLRKEFVSARNHAWSLRKTTTSIGRLLVFFGGIDLTDETSKTLDALDELKRPNLSVDVVLGGQNPKRKMIEQRIASKKSFRCLVDVTNISELMLSAQLSIGAGGATTWERCCMGLPSLVISVADNQIRAALDLDGAGCHIYLGHSSEITVKKLKHAISECLDHPIETLKLGQKSMELVDGQGCQRVASTVCPELYL